MKKIINAIARFGATLSLGTRFAVGATLCAVLAVAASLAIAIHKSEAELSRLGMAKIDQDMRALWAIGRAKGWPARIEDGKLRLGDHTVNDNHAIVDQVKEIGAGTVTIFQRQGDEFVRVTTNVPGANGGRAVGTKLARNAAYAANIAGQPFRGRIDILGAPYFTGYDPIKNAQGEVIGIMYVGDAEAAFTAAIKGITIQAAILAAGVLATAILVLWLVVRRMIRPLVRMETAMSRISGGDTSCEIPGLGRGDEVGRMATALEVFRDKVAENARNIEERKSAEEAAERDRVQVRHKLADDFDSAVRDVIGELVSSSDALNGTAATMHELAGKAGRDSTVVASASEEASSNVQTVAAATEELSASIAEISRQVSQSATIASKAVEEAGRTDNQIQALAEGAQKIGDIVKLINDIAGQTNLLALNATIEAARAGEAGKGFAVVASEVKSLANQTAKATEDIAAQVNAIQTQTSGAVAAIKTIGSTIGEINQIATTIASAVEEQGAATQEIARNVQQAAAGTAEVTKTTGSVAAIIQESSGTAGTLAAAAQRMSGNTDRLKQEVARFLATVRAA